MVPTSTRNVSLAADAMRPICRACAEINNQPRSHLGIPDAASLQKPASYLWHVPYIKASILFLIVVNSRKNYREMNATADYPSSPNVSDVDASESALSTPEPNLSDPRSLQLSDAAHFSNSTDVVCISGDKGDEPPPQKKLTNFFKSAKTKTPAFPNALRQYDPQPRRAQKQASATGVQQSVNQSSGSSQNPPTTSTDPSSLVHKWKAVYASDTPGQKLGFAKAYTDAEAARHFCVLRTTLCA